MVKWCYILGVIFLSCSATQDKEVKLDSEREQLHLIHDISSSNDDKSINVVIEIPTGSIEKWEVNKETGQLEWSLKNGKPRRINYLGYPGNYGMIPQTLLPKELGGDGDPLDILILGPALERGSVISCKIIGGLELLDHGEQDDKLIGVLTYSPFYEINSIEELENEFEGTTAIIETFFSNYKGPGKMVSRGFFEKEKAMEILQHAQAAYQLTIE